MSTYFNLTDKKNDVQKKENANHQLHIICWGSHKKFHSHFIICRIMYMLCKRPNCWYWKCTSFWHDMVCVHLLRFHSRFGLSDVISWIRLTSSFVLLKQCMHLSLFLAIWSMDYYQVMLMKQLDWFFWLRLLPLLVQIFSLKVTLDALCKVLPCITAQGWVTASASNSQTKCFSI
jgi:hypothetical protein